MKLFLSLCLLATHFFSHTVLKVTIVELSPTTEMVELDKIIYPEIRARALIKLGKICISSNPQKAITCFTTAMELDQTQKTRVSCLLGIAKCYHSAPLNARAIYGQAINAAGDNARLALKAKRKYTACLFEVAGQRQEAIRLLTSLIFKASTKEEYVILGRIYIQLGAFYSDQNDAQNALLCLLQLAQIKQKLESMPD